MDNLTWKDIKKIVTIADEVTEEVFNTEPLVTEEEYYTEILGRLNLP